MYRDASHLWRSFSHNRTKINIQFLSVIYRNLKGSCKYSIYISQCHSPSPQRKLQIFNLYIAVSFTVTLKEAANIQFISNVSQCHSPSPRRKLKIHVFNLYFTYIYISETIHKHQYKNYIHLYMYLSFKLMMQLLYVITIFGLFTWYTSYMVYNVAEKLCFSLHVTYM